MVGTFDFRAIESDVRKLWDEKHIYKKAKERASRTAPKFNYLDGPPYTSGKVHIGTAWGKVLRDLVMRYKRMQGFLVWDRAGYDMHGLPTENPVQRMLGLTTPEDVKRYGLEQFIEACRKFCIANMQEMNKTFKDLGVWMDFDHAYMPITREFMDGEWWFIKTAHEKGRIYEGERTMTWDAVNGTAVAKHELEYKSITDTAIYVRLPITRQENTYLIIWTTTPWTIPFNLGVMANPQISYCKIKIVWNGEIQYWYVAKDLLDTFVKSQLDKEYVIEKEFLGSELEGMSYTHPFAHQNPIYSELKERMPKVHTVLLSSEYVDTSTGTGLVHCAPGCGPEDYEVGHRNGIKPFNTIDEGGVCRQLKPFEGLVAKEDDDEFIRLIDEQGALIYQHKYMHEYPHGERSHKPVIFRTTKQWFLKVEDIKDRLIEENNKIAWVPQAAYNAFNSWLENLRDNSISKQRFWGTPIPIWRNVDDPTDFIVVGSSKELAELAGLKAPPEDLHRSTVDKIIIKRKGKDDKMHEYHRILDVLDVWVDAGTASWNCLDFPSRKDLFDQWYPASFILEGKDQIRGWFNLLHIASMIAFDKPAFKAVYMHGFINDAQGRKMSKSLGNYILPSEVTSKYGVDATRYYMIGAANPGLDMNYNFDDLDAKFKNLLVYWNMHKYAIELAQLHSIAPRDVGGLKLGLEEQYLLSRLHSTIQKMTGALDTYQLNEVPQPVEEFLLDMSRTYIQLVRDKATAGSDEEKEIVASVLIHTLTSAMTLFAPIAPYFSETIYQNFTTTFSLPDESIHLLAWPKPNEELINTQLEQDMVVAKDAIAAILSARDKAQLGVRWPVAEVRVDCSAKQSESLRRMEDLVKIQTNTKVLSFEPVDVDFTIEANTKTIGKQFGKDTPTVVQFIEEHTKELIQMLKDQKDHVVIDNRTLKEEHLNVARVVPEKYQTGEGNLLHVYLDVIRTPELEREGYAREIIRRIQQLRKNANLVKSDRIAVEIATADEMLHATLKEHHASIAERTGTSKLKLVDTLSQHFENTSTEKIKGSSFVIGFMKTG